MQKDAHDGRMITTPPRLSGLCLQQSSFRRLIEPILWNYILDNVLEEGKEVNELSSDEEDDSVVSPTPPVGAALIKKKMSNIIIWSGEYRYEHAE